MVGGLAAGLHLAGLDLSDRATKDLLFQMAAEKEDDTNNKRKREESSSDDDEDDDKTEDIPQKDNGRKTMSIDQSLFSIDERKKSAEETPKFSCGSTIQMQASQCPSIGGDESEDDERQTATASQLDRVLMASSGKKSDMKSPPPSEKKVEILFRFRFGPR